MNVLDAREKLATVLAPVEDSDPTVLTSLVDALEPPVLMLGWGDPWWDPAMTTGVMRRPSFCSGTGHLVVTAVASRLVPGDGIAVLERLAHYTYERLSTDEDFGVEGITGPRVFLIARTNYLAARISVRATVTL